MSEDMNNVKDKTYLGDGVYAGFDGYQIWLQVEDREQAIIAMEPKVYENLVDYIKHLETKYNFKYST